MKCRKKPVIIEAVQFTEEMLWWYILEDKPLPEGLWFKNASYNTSDRLLHYYNVFCGPKNDDFESTPAYFGEWVVYEPEPEGTKIYTDEYFRNAYEQVEE